MSTTEKLSLNEALEMLSMAEIRVIERHFGKEFGNGMNAVSEMTVGAIYCLEKRKALAENAEKIPGWDDIDKLTMREVGAYFADDAFEVDPSEPETDQGKDDSLAA